MAVKAVNNTAGLDGLVPTLLVYGVYLRMSKLDSPALSITERAAIIRKVIAEVVKLRAKQTVNNALHHRNGPNTTSVYNFPLNSKVLIWRKSGSWNGFYHLLVVKNKTCCVQFFSRPTSFQNTFIKPYFQSKNTHNIKPDKPEITTKLDELETPAKPDKLEATAEPDELEVTIKSDELEAPLPTLEVP